MNFTLTSHLPQGVCHNITGFIFEITALLKSLLTFSTINLVNLSPNAALLKGAQCQIDGQLI